MASIPICSSESENLILEDHKQIGNNHSLGRIDWMAKAINIYVSSLPKKRLALCMWKRYPQRKTLDILCIQTVGAEKKKEIEGGRLHGAPCLKVRGVKISGIQSQRNCWFSCAVIRAASSSDGWMFLEFSLKGIHFSTLVDTCLWYPKAIVPIFLYC